ncbi:MAG: hypothetical protein SPI12_01640 [Actinomycetaceae bacterium]|nr:hypothetical protein [Actinomycetaceae bacterium]MDY6082550.1 hypothetical protein [Actinomycetaceae bacterium]
MLSARTDYAPLDSFGDEGEEFSVIAAYQTEIHPEEIQEYVKRKLNYRPPAGD